MGLGIKRTWVSHVQCKATPSVPVHPSSSVSGMDFWPLQFGSVLGPYTDSLGTHGVSIGIESWRLELSLEGSENSVLGCLVLVRGI